MEDKKLSGNGEPKFSDIGKEVKNSGFSKWFENFWYHYKFHTIIGTVAVVTLFICIIQMITRDEYDYQIMYAGPQIIALRDRTYMEDAVEALADDYNGDGKVVIAFDDIVMLSPEEQKEAAENGAVFNGEFNMNSMTEYYQQIFGGDAVICILSPYMYGVVREGDGFLPLAEVLETVPDSAYDDYGISLLKTEFGQYFNGMNDLPEDTILCVRRLSTMATFKGTEKTKKDHEANLDLFRKMVNFTAPVEAGTSEETSEFTVSSDDVTVTDIVDRTQTESIPTDQALELFFSDDGHKYFFPSIRSQYITVFYSDGTAENIKEALEAGRAHISDLDRFEIPYSAEPKVTDIEYKATYIRADSMTDGAFSAFMKYCENASTMAISSVQHIPLAHFSDSERFGRFVSDISENYQTDISYNGEASLLEKAAEYDKAFFEENDLLILELYASSGSIRHEVEFVRGRKSPLVYVCINRIIPEVVTSDVANWFALIVVPKDDIETALNFDAWYK